ncbi:MAG: hypothetical protein MZV64_16570 [Ignavibacteriales bacterium]|nr:hypothetical protein [Ignavibacteriales bacterium]
MVDERADWSPGDDEHHPEEDLRPHQRGFIVLGEPLVEGGDQLADIEDEDIIDDDELAEGLRLRLDVTIGQCAPSATIRSPAAMKSRMTIIQTIHPSMRPRERHARRAAEERTLSARGSRNSQRELIPNWRPSRSYQSRAPPR